VKPALLLVALLMLAACGKKGPPTPPGPPNEIIYPRTYPTR
jgi:predicted small lipoprotein YifL